MSEWYYAHNNEPLGPISDDLFYQLRTTGTIDPETLVWREGMSDWQQLAQLPGMIESSATARAPAPASSKPVSTTDTPASTMALPDSMARCTECGCAFDADNMVHYETDIVCAECKPVYFQRLRESGTPTGQMHYGGFWIRACASILDGAILYAASWPIARLETWALGRQTSAGDSVDVAFGIAVGLLAILVSSVLQVAYDTFFVGRYAATPGKMAMGLRVIRSDGDKVSYLRAAGRSLAALLSFLTLCIGFLMAAFDKEKRTLHDHICDTRVVYK